MRKLFLIFHIYEHIHIVNIDNSGAKGEKTMSIMDKIITEKELYHETGSWGYDFVTGEEKWVINTSSILSFLIKEAGKYCERFASDLFISWQAVEKALTDENYTGGRYVFAIRDCGVDGNLFAEARLESPDMYGKYPYKAFYILDAEIKGKDIRMSLKETTTGVQPKKHDLALIEKPGEEGLSKTEILSLLNNMADSSEMYPIELMAKEHESCAMGFITKEAAKILDFDYEGSELHNFIAAILDDIEKENPDHQYGYKGIDVFLSR